MAGIVSTISRGIIAVTSCKGGVGKSTVALELAMRLASRGHRVGLYDADIHGPSLPSQLPSSFSDTRVRLSEDGYFVQPIMCDNLSLMSFGWFSQLWGNRRRHANDNSKLQDNDVTLRGTTIGLLAVQLLHTTMWGNLDYLIVDTPPGTGDVPQMLAKKVPLSGAVVVTTPSNLAAVDVLKGVRMLERCKVPILAVVENMSSFQCGNCQEVHFPFGRGHIEKVLEGIQQHNGKVVPSISLPIVPNIGIGTKTDSGHIPHTLPLPEEFISLAESVENGCSNMEINLPQGLGFNELPHWPMEMEMHELDMIK